MAHGLEVRVPFLDNGLVDFANSLPDEFKVRGLRGKWLLRRAFADCLPRHVTRPLLKKGFGLPLGEWFRGGLGDYFESQVLSTNARTGAWFNRNACSELLDRHRARKADLSGTLWSVLMFELWLGHVERRFEKPVGNPFQPDASPRR